MTGTLVTTQSHDCTNEESREKGVEDREKIKGWERVKDSEEFEWFRKGKREKYDYNTNEKVRIE